MSCNYADGLSPYDNKGKLGLPETFDPDEEVDKKIKQLAEWVKQSKHTVFYTGAGISTSAGIPDFRGPKGVWTLEKKGLRPDVSVDWNDAKPTKSHMAIKKLMDLNQAQFLISQNIDGLHMRSGMSRQNLAELHGNMFVDACAVCRKQFVRQTPAPTVGQKPVGGSCRSTGRRPCRGKLVDFVLDWEAELPDQDLILSDSHSMLSELSIVIGSTLQIVPAGTMPTLTKKYRKGKLVIINLQPTKHDKKADLIIRCYVDKVMERLFVELGQDIPSYNPSIDPTTSSELVEWTQNQTNAKNVENLSKKVESEYKAELKRQKAMKNDSSKKVKLEPKSENGKVGDGVTEEVVKRNADVKLESDDKPDLEVKQESDVKPDPDASLDIKPDPGEPISAVL